MSLDKAIEKRNKKDELDIKSLNYLFKVTKLRINDLSIILTSDDLDKVVEVVGILNFRILLKFRTFEASGEAESKMTNCFIELLNRLKTHSRNEKNTDLDILKYENYLKGIDALEFALPFGFIENQKTVKIKDKEFGEVIARQSSYNISEYREELIEAYNTFRAVADKCMQDNKLRFDELQITKNIQLIKDDFKTQMLKLCELYKIEAKEEIKKANLANAIAKYFKKN